MVKLDKLVRCYWYVAKHTWKQPIFWLFFVIGPLVVGGIELWRVLGVGVIVLVVPIGVMLEWHRQNFFKK